MSKTEVKVPGELIIPDALLGVLRQVTNGGKGHLVCGPHLDVAVVAHQVRLDALPDIADDLFFEPAKTPTNNSIKLNR